MDMKNIAKYSSLLLLIVGLSSAITSCNNSADEGTANEDSSGNSNQYAEAVLTGSFADTSLSGVARFERIDNEKVKLNITINAPKKANQSVAVHIHETGDCGEMANMAGGHWNPTGAIHGKWGNHSFHSGDIGNISLNDQGQGSMELESDLWTIGGDEKKNILNKAVIVHGGVDDYTSQPSGNSGTRIGCGTIMAKKE